MLIVQSLGIALRLKIIVYALSLLQRRAAGCFHTCADQFSERL